MSIPKELGYKYGLVKATNVTADAWDMLRENALMNFNTFDDLKLILDTFDVKDDLYVSTGYYPFVLYKDGVLTALEYISELGTDMLKQMVDGFYRTIEYVKENKYSTSDLINLAPTAYKLFLYELLNDKNRDALLTTYNNMEYGFSDYPFTDDFKATRIDSKGNLALDLAHLHDDIDSSEEFTIYRGEASKSTPYKDALSWSLNKETAEMFAERFKTDGKIYQATVKFDDILGYMDNEEEIIVEGSKVFNVKEIK